METINDVLNFLNGDIKHTNRCRIEHFQHNQKNFNR